MKISLNWLKDYLHLDKTPEEIAHILTHTGLEVGGIQKIAAGLEGVVTGEVVTKAPHPNADRLSVTHVNIGAEKELQIVCGASNVAVGQKVMVATVGTTLHPNSEKSLDIRRSTIRGIDSFGMICAEDELGVNESQKEGILVLEKTTPIGLAAKEYFQLEDDFIFEIDLTPNRSDATGHLGVARDIKAFLNYHQKKELSVQWPKITLPEGRKSEQLAVSLQDEKGCLRYSGVVIRGVAVDSSPNWLQKRLRAIGLNPINNLVDISNYVLHETGNPLHVFDMGAVGQRLIVRKAREREKLVTLDGVERELNTHDVVIANEQNAICLAGAMGGHNSSVGGATCDILIEAAYFDAVSIRRTAKRHGLHTDASFRFERGVDPNAIIYARDRAAALVLKLAGGTVDQYFDFYPVPIEDKKVTFYPEESRKLMGTALPTADMNAIFHELDIQVVKKASDEEIVYRVPAYRVDVERAADLTEELLRIYGYNQIPIPQKLTAPLIHSPLHDREKMQRSIADLLVNRGWYEVVHNSLTSLSTEEKMTAAAAEGNKVVELLNPLSRELNVMRQTLLSGGMKTIAYHQNRQFPDLKLFEMGNTYQKEATTYTQRTKIGLWICGRKEPENWNNNSKPTDFFYLKGILEAILKKLGHWNNTTSHPLQNNLLTTGVQLHLNKQPLAEIGEVKKEICLLFDIKQAVFYAELDSDVLLSQSSEKSTHFHVQPIPKIPFVQRDFSLLLDRHVPFSDIRRIAQQVEKKRLREVDLFDVYEGDHLPKEKKSYAVRFTFQDANKTLKDKQIDAVMEAIRQELEQQLGAVLR